MRPDDGKVPCSKCGQRLCTGFTAESEYAHTFVCGDCIEGRTPLKQEIARLKAEVLEARNEASVVRRAYLHEKARAEAAIDTLGAEGYGPVANRLAEQAYKGPAERMCLGRENLGGQLVARRSKMLKKGR